MVTEVRIHPPPGIPRLKPALRPACTNGGTRGRVGGTVLTGGQPGRRPAGAFRSAPGQLAEFWARHTVLEDRGAELWSRAGPARTPWEDPDRRALQDLSDWLAALRLPVPEGGKMTNKAMTTDLRDCCGPACRGRQATTCPRHIARASGWETGG